MKYKNEIHFHWFVGCQHLKSVIFMYLLLQGSRSKSAVRICDLSWCSTAHAMVLGPSGLSSPWHNVQIFRVGGHVMETAMGERRFGLN